MEEKISYINKKNCNKVVFFKKLSANKSDNVGEMDKFLER